VIGDQIIWWTRYKSSLWYLKHYDRGYEDGS
jgi:hypothetical protein